MIHIRALDLNLLLVFDCLMRHKNVSRAARELGVSQSAVSHALARLRDHYKDPLFVRVSKGVVPTEFALELKAEAEDFVYRAGALAEKARAFEPRRAKGRVVISTTDYFEIVFGAKILERLHREAPDVQVSFRPTSGELPKKELENGACDLAIAGFYMDLPEGFYRQRLFSDTFSTAFRKGHPIAGRRLDAKRFFDCEHALITIHGDFKDNHARVINGQKRTRRIKYGSSSFTGPAWIIANSDLVLTAPTALLNRYKDYFPIQVEACPVEMKPIEVQMVWHSLTHQNPLRKWFRQVVKDVCA